MCRLILIIGRASMRYCKNCKMTYQTPLNHCLFCNNELTVDQEFKNFKPENQTSTSEDINYHYPQFQSRRKSGQLFKKFINFIILISIVSCIFLDLIDDSGFGWSMYPMTSCVYVLYLVYLYSSKRKTIKKVTYNAYATIIFLLLLGFYSKSPFWAVDFPFPLGILAINLCLTFYFVVRKRKSLHDIAIYILVASILGLIPLVLFFTKQLTYAWPSVCCGLYSLMVLSGLTFFSTNQTKDEIKRRFHL
jgi:hypothetical protein